MKNEPGISSSMNLYAIGAEFKTVAEVYHAAEVCRDRGFRWWDVYSPFPIHGLDKAMGLKKSWVSAMSLGGAAMGLLTALLLQTITSVYVYPMVVQGKPYFSLPAFVPILFELTILLTAFGTILGLLLFNLLPRYHHPVFHWDYFTKKVTDDGFFIIIEAQDPQFSEEEIPEFLEKIGGFNITRIPRDNELNAHQATLSQSS